MIYLFVRRPILFNFTCMEMTNDSNSLGLKDTFR